MLTLSQRIKVSDKAIKHDALFSSHNTFKFFPGELFPLSLCMDSIGRNYHLCKWGWVGIRGRFIWNWEGYGDNINILLCEESRTITGILHRRTKNDSHWKGEKIYIDREWPFFWISWCNGQPGPLLLNKCIGLLSSNIGLFSFGRPLQASKDSIDGNSNKDANADKHRWRIPGFLTGIVLFVSGFLLIGYGAHCFEYLGLKWRGFFWFIIGGSLYVVGGLLMFIGPYLL